MSGGDAPYAAELLTRCRFPAERGELNCAVSGGADSLALLVLAVRAGFSVTAFHVDHGLRPGSASEAGLVASVASRCGAKFVALSVDLSGYSGDGNLEARAREARYGVLPEKVATGHTSDDGAETVLLNLMWGSGLDGLAPLVGASVRIRPLVRLRRAETTRLCQTLGLQPLQDPMNTDPRFRRVRVRQEVLPLLNDIAGRDVVPLLLRLADTVDDDVAVLDELASAIDPTSAIELRTASRALARRAVRGWLVASGVGDGHPPPLAVIDRVLAVALGETPRADLIEGWRVARRFQRLRIERIGPDRT